MEETCYVCRKHLGQEQVPGGILYEDALVVLTHGRVEDNQTSAYPGVLFVEPRRHTPSMATLAADEARQIGLVCTVACSVLSALPDVERVYMAALGHHVDHLHIWLIPRYTGTPERLFGIDVITWDDAPRAELDELAELANHVGKAIRNHPFTQA